VISFLHRTASTAVGAGTVITPNAAAVRRHCRHHLPASITPVTTAADVMTGGPPAEDWPADGNQACKWVKQRCFTRLYPTPKKFPAYSPRQRCLRPPKPRVSDSKKTQKCKEIRRITLLTMAYMMPSRRRRRQNRRRCPAAAPHHDRR
jgi:hypothetical protein